MQKMIKWMPISYKIKYRGYRKRSHDSVDVREDVPLDIRVYDRSEVTHVAEIAPMQRKKTAEELAKTGFSRTTEKKVPYAPETPYDLYEVDGVLMRPQILEDGRCATLENLLEVSAGFNGRSAGSASPVNRDYPFIHDYNNPLATSFREERGDLLYEVISDNRAERLVESQATADTVAFLDDVLLVPAIEPLIEVEVRKAYTKSSSTVVRLLPSGIEQAGDDTVLFRLDEYDTAIGLAKLLASTYDRTYTTAGDIELEDGKPLRFDATQETITRIRNMIEAPRRSGFGSSTTTDTIRLWCDARDSWASFEGREIGVDETISKVRTYQRAMGDVDYGRQFALFAQLFRLETLPPPISQEDAAALGF